eukprot:gnl/MRDRNA2_/MRDRNA2_112400_c0_seq1.p1 gnl/MRDRNA2_/MRDRNA2_112400_c0~~gnl/MRDRNA2_/MRDRNA2_112400_c0_seq1.p1  ORF type:complete len:418 (-),score=114.67 gnl/MRDRNA2_/MRDRNA2_112400_c0_seq1:71-1324(-)
MGEDHGVDDINSLIAQCSSAELEEILRTLDADPGDAAQAGTPDHLKASDMAPAPAPVSISEAPNAESAPAPPVEAAPAAEEAPATSEANADTEAVADPSLDQDSVKEVVGAVIRKSLQEGIEIQEKLMAQCGTPSVTEAAVETPGQPEASSSSALTVPATTRAEVVSPAPGAESGHRAPPPSPAAKPRDIAEIPPMPEVPALPEVTTSKEETKTEAPKPAEPVTQAVSTTAAAKPSTEGPTLDTILQLMKDQHQSVVAQVQWVASMSMPSTEYLTGVLSQKDEDIAKLQAKLDHLRAEVQAKDDRIENQSLELNECIQSCRHWLVDLEFHKQKLDESMLLNAALEDANKNLEAEIDNASQQVKHASLDVEHAGGLSRTPIVTPRGISIGWGGYSGIQTGYCGIPMQGSVPWVFRKHR